ncbi:6-bladed beta-propeller [candidate division KSB1 bacterium]|nr:6-bladed beta-propeller [candidate division KSB1 bacterium]
MVVDNEGNIFVSDVGNHRVQKYSSEGQFLNSFGSQGMGPGEFMVSNNIEIGPSGNLYLAAIRKQRFIEFDSNGKTLREFNAEGMPTQRELNLSPLGFYFVGPVTSEFYITSNSTIIFKDMSNFATLRIHDLNGGVLKSFGETYTFEDEFFNRYGNEI